MSREYLFEKEIRLTAPLEEVFGFFSSAENLARLTPAFIGFTIISPCPIEMRVGATIDYRIRILGIPLKWRSLITEWEPPERFADEQLKGPYKKWVHVHTFATRGSEVFMTDRVQYQVPGGPLAPLVHALIVGPQVRAIFAYRNKVIGELFGGVSKD